ncbi:related to OTU domain-containing protein 6B [Fusarium torulosum]|uniref:Related to OTU domain-containing protein 6B n=1 Tax=Fusarium torulosum TaxID=33205 RepID=A0AAE8MLP5_9HYPO|nr:related to OTU domain-containing protein 6B [Fusarium torulosum]
MDSPAPTETLEQVQTRHRRELKDLQGRITGKKKNATKKTRKGVNDECAGLERQLREKQASEIAALNHSEDNNDNDEQDEVAAEINGQVEEDELAKETEKLSVLEPVEQQQQPGKKRNRQKERLARRAAEQEAEAQRAEEEASNMTNHRAKESEYMKTTFEKNGLVEKDIAPDGHCLFSAVADQLGHNDIPLGDSDVQKEPAYKTVRRVASNYMLEHGDDFAPFLEEDLEGYARKMRDTAEWGGQLELMALARQYKAEIRVVQDGRLERIGEEEGAESGKTLWLAYYRHGYGLGEHYNSLRKAP